MATVSTIDVRVLLFAHLSDIGGGEIVIQSPRGSTIREVVALLAVRDSRYASGIASARFAVNGEWADEHVTLTNGDELAIIVPVSGG